jgi:hypothetical protein
LPDTPPDAVIAYVPTGLDVVAVVTTVGTVVKSLSFSLFTKSL